MPLEWEIHIWPNRPSFTSRVSFSRQLWPFGRLDNGLDLCAGGTRIECGGRMLVTEVFPGNSGEQSGSLRSGCGAACFSPAQSRVK
jgi:hypothetical protein